MNDMCFHEQQTLLPALLYFCHKPKKLLKLFGCLALSRAPSAVETHWACTIMVLCWLNANQDSSQEQSQCDLYYIYLTASRVFSGLKIGSGGRSCWCCAARVSARWRKFCSFLCLHCVHFRINTPRIWQKFLKVKIKSWTTEQVFKISVRNKYHSFTFLRSFPMIPNTSHFGVLEDGSQDQICSNC